ncbi:carboxylesterase family protein [Myroides odoratimimus]|uniref:carboxylesterase family protein n=1 Tax=Myroides odoratimimus TaxID=76832 RepID=UPI0004690B79|nr:prolyl oligopeptidase family serine peptidase [Myroides odoratimimus]
MKFLTVLIYLVSLTTFAQPKAILDKTTYQFWLNEPKVVEEKNPLIIFLHGRSLSGTNIDRVKRYGALKGIEKGLDIPAYLVAPQLPSGPWNADKVDEIVSYMIANYNIDESRIYVTGMSLGGYGTMKYAGKYPNRIAAAIAICGGGEERDACAVTNIPIKLIHGDKDFIVPLKESKKIMTAIQKCDKKAPVELQVVKGGTHGSVEDLYRHMEVYNWLLQHVKSDASVSSENKEEI